MSDEHGKLIHLTYEGGLPEELVIRGHVSDEVALAEVADYYGDDWRDQDFARFLRHVPVRIWGAKLQTATSRAEEWAYEFRSYDKPGRGRFPVTIFERRPLCTSCWGQCGKCAECGGDEMLP